MFCPKCGKENDDGAQFCGSCGNKLGAAPEAKQSPAVSTTATGGVTAGDGSTAAAAHKTGRILVIIGVVVVLAVAIAAFVTGGFGLLGPKYEVKASVDAYSWEELSNISDEIAKASSEDAAIEVAKTYNLATSEGKLDGSQMKFVSLSDGTQATVQIAGFAHDDKTDGGKAGITFIFKNIIAEHDMNSSDKGSGGWEGSQMRSWLASDGMNMLPDDLRNCLVAVNKFTNNVGETKDVSSVTATSDKLWLCSYVELAGKISETGFSSSADYAPILDAEGTQYKVFADMGVSGFSGNAVSENADLVKQFKGQPNIWWERSPAIVLSGNFLEVSETGIPFYVAGFGMGMNDEQEEHGVVPGFCI